MSQVQHLYRLQQYDTEIMQKKRRLAEVVQLQRETELLLAYGYVNFASKAGQLSGNHFLTLTGGQERLYELGRYVLYHGAVDLEIAAG